MVRPSLPVLHKIIVYLRHSGYVNHRTEKRGHSWCLTQVLVLVLRSIFNLRLCAASLILPSQTEVGRGVMGQWSDHVDGDRIPSNEMRALKSCFCICVCLPND